MISDSNKLGVVNIAPASLVVFSSRSKYSHTDDDTEILMNTRQTGFSFHTEFELNPWLIVDLNEIHELHSIKVTNRLDCCQEKASKLKIQSAIVNNLYNDTLLLSENNWGGG